MVGGGNSALEEAVTLTRYASKITVVHQFDHFQAFEQAIREAEANPKIEFIMESELRSFIGNGALESVTIEHLPTGSVSEKKINVIGWILVFVYVSVLQIVFSFP